MASITTILGTDSVSSSRIVINQNFDALNTQLGEFASVLDTTMETLSLNGEVKSGTLKINNGALDTFKVTTTELIANVESTFNQKAFFNKGIVASIQDAVASIPTGGYDAATYILDLNAPSANFASPITLSPAEDGQQITFIVSGTPTLVGTDPNVSPVVVFETMSTIEGVTAVEVAEHGSITFVYDGSISRFRVISAMNSTVQY